MEDFEQEYTQTPQTEPQQQEPAQPQEFPPRKEHKQRTRKPRKAGRAVAAVVAALALIAGSCAATSVFYTVRMTAQSKRTEQTLSQLQQQIAQLKEELNSKSFTGNGNSISGSENTAPDGGLTPGQLYADVVNSVVAITTEIRVGSGSQITSGVSYGTGFILTQDGYIVTNYHVVENASKLTVTTHDGTDHTATIRGYDAANDLAVLKIEAQGLQCAVIGSSDDLIVGDRVAVIGNPLGDLNSTLTMGYVSGKDRVISTDGSLINMLQTDASVNPGNSGGPIFNMKGEVVGIITAKYSGTTASGASIEGIGFAIPIDDVTHKIDDLKNHGYITGGYLGVMVHDVDQNVAEYYGLPYGVYVSDATEGYCAAKAGVKAKDIIIGLGDKQITNMNELTRALQEYQGGEETTITVWRGGMEIVLEITLDAKPKQ